MEETKIEQELQAVEEIPAPAEEVAEVPTEEVVADVPAEEVAEAPVVEGCDCDKAESCKPKKEEEDDQDEKKVAVKEGLQVEHDAKQRQEVAKEQKKDVLEALQAIADEHMTSLVIEAMDNLPIDEGMSESDIEARKAEIMEHGKMLLEDAYLVLEEMVNGTTVEMNGHQIEVKDFVGTGGKVGMGLPAGINPPCKSENDESEKKVVIKAYHEGMEEIDYKSKYAESEALMDELVEMVEKTSAKYTSLVEEYNEVVAKLNAYQIAESYGITVDDAADMLTVGSYQEVAEALEGVEAEFANGIIVEEKEEAPAEEEKETKEDEKEKEDKEKEAGKEITEGCDCGECDDCKAKAEEKKEEKEDEDKEKKEEKAMEEIKESVDGTVISESEDSTSSAHRAFSVFGNPVFESKKSTRKAYSVFAD